MKPLLIWAAKRFAYLIFKLPKWIHLVLGDAVAYLWWSLLRIRREVVLSNLKLAYPDMDPLERKKIAWKSMQNLGRGAVEYFKFPFLSKKNINNWVRFEGEEHIEAALKKGKGVCLLSLHTGNGDFALAGLALADYPICLISKEFKIKWLNELWFSLRGRLGMTFIPPRNSSFSVIRSLKKNKIVIFVLDQFMGPPIGVRTQFFGHETGTALGLAVMAMRTGAEVIPLYTIRENGNHHLIKFEAPIPFETKEDRPSTTAHMTQVYTDKIEQIIRQYPDQWMWVHRRWKEFKD